MNNLTKNNKELLEENIALSEKIKDLKKKLHDKFFSSMEDMSLEDYDLITEQETDAIFKGNKKGDFILVNVFAAKLTGYSGTSTSFTLMMFSVIWRIGRVAASVMMTTTNAGSVKFTS